MTREEKLAYSKGYNRGRIGVWPDHRPPRPPDEIVGPLVLALQNMRSALDGELATLDPDDPDNRWEQVFGPLIEDADKSMERLSEFLLNESSQS